MQLEVWYLYFININGWLQYLNHIRILSIPFSLDLLILLRRFTNTFTYTKAHLFQGFPKRYCKSKLVKAFWSYILKVGNKKMIYFLYKFEDFTKWNFAVRLMKIWSQISHRNDSSLDSCWCQQFANWIKNV